MHTSSPEDTHITMEEAKELKDTTWRLEEENKELRSNLHHVAEEKNNLKWEIGWKETQLKGSE